MIKLPKNWRDRRRIIEMWNIYPYCYWCGSITKLYFKNGGDLPHDSATMDHIYIKKERTKYNHNKRYSPVILSCYKCNTERQASYFDYFSSNKNKKLDDRFIYYSGEVGVYR